MNTTAQDFKDHVNAGLDLTEVNGKAEWIGKDKNWTAYEWLVDGISPLAVHDYLVAQG